jgi:transcriptional regulator with XRE-family HTH domain
MPASESDSSRPTFEQVVGGVLRSIRTERGLSQERLGNESGSGRTYISQLERGERGPSLKTVFRLSRTLGVPSFTGRAGGREGGFRRRLRTSRQGNRPSNSS